MEEYTFNEHGKDEFLASHTTEHLLNQLMFRMFGCDRSSNAHFERKKSKMTFTLDRIGDYDICPCLGKHVKSTAQIGKFELLGTNY